jgi:hypothetical protein
MGISAPDAAALEHGTWGIWIQRWTWRVTGAIRRYIEILEISGRWRTVETGIPYIASCALQTEEKSEARS